MAPSMWVDRRGAKRNVPMQVLVLGFPRTGTMSMRAALKILGYHDVHHMQSLFENPLEVDMWMEALHARYNGKGKPYGREEWDQLLGHCEAVTDTPAACFPEDLVAAYPDAKVVLTNRDPDKWWASYKATIGATLVDPTYQLAALLDRRSFGRVAALSWLSMDVMVGTEREILADDGATARARFRKHYDLVRSIVPRERLLEYEVKEGWGPLCAFLGKDVPEVEFPRMNETTAFQKRLKAAVANIVRPIITRIGLVCILASGVYFALRYATSV